MGGFDWLWSQHHEIERCKLVETAQAVWSFETAFRQHVLKLIKEKEDEEDEGDIDHLALQRKDEWIPWLESILRNIIEHINPPAALGQGFRDVQDHQRNMTSPPRHRFFRSRCGFMCFYCVTSIHG